MSSPLMFEKAVAARALVPGQLVVLDGRVVELGPEPEDAGRVRIVIVAVLGPPPGDRPDPREIVLTCESGQSFVTARRFGPGEALLGPGLSFGGDGLALEETVGVEGLDAGRIIVFDGEVVTGAPDAPGSVRVLLHVGSSRRELVVVCPADMELGTARRGEPRGPHVRLHKARVAGRFEAGEVVVVDGRVVESAPDPEDAGRVRLVIVPAFPSGEDSDQRELVLSCPRDMELGTAIPHHPPQRSS